MAFVSYPVRIMVMYIGQVCADCIVSVDLTTADSLSFLDANGQPIFSMKFLVERYLDMSPEDMELNEKYKQQEILEKIETAKRMKQHAEYNQQHQQQPVQAPGNEGGDFGGGGGGDFGADFGSGGGEDFMSTSGGDFGGGDMGGGTEEPAADTGGGGEDFA